MTLRIAGSGRSLSSGRPGDAWQYALVDDYQDWRPEPFPDGWMILDQEARVAIRSELSKELAPAHPLYGLTLSPVGKCIGCDETLVFVEDETRWALVHPTWASRPEQPPWPQMRKFGAKMPSDAMREHAHHVSP